MKLQIEMMAICWKSNKGEGKKGETEERGANKN